LERALVCRNLDWKKLPQDLDDASLELKHASESLFIFEAFRQYATDLEQLSPGQQDLINAVENMRDTLRKHGN